MTATTATTLRQAEGSTFTEVRSEVRADRHGEPVVQVTIAGHPADHVIVLSAAAARSLAASLREADNQIRAAR